MESMRCCSARSKRRSCGKRTDRRIAVKRHRAIPCRWQVTGTRVALSGTERRVLAGASVPKRTSRNEFGQNCRRAGTLAAGYSVSQENQGLPPFFSGRWCTSLGWPECAAGSQVSTLSEAGHHWLASIGTARLGPRAQSGRPAAACWPPPAAGHIHE